MLFQIWVFLHVLIVSLVLVPISCSCWSFLVAGPDFLVTRRCPNPILFLRFGSSSSSLHQFPVLVQESVFGSCTRSPRQIFEVRTSSVLLAIFFCSCCDFFSLCSLLPAQSEARMSRNPSVSPRFCPLKLFARPCLAAAGLLCLLLRFSFRFAEDSRDPLRFWLPSTRVFGLRAKGQSSRCHPPLVSLVRRQVTHPATARDFQFLVPLRISVLVLQFFPSFPVLGCPYLMSAISATLLLLLAQSVVFLCNRIKSS
jgi:hypothetical protein